MASEPSPSIPGLPADASSRETNPRWEDLQADMPATVDGFHLIPCPKCGAENGVAAPTCWSCEAVLAAAAPLRLVTKDGTDVPAQAGAEPRPPTSAPGARPAPVPRDAPGAAEDFDVGAMLDALPLAASAQAPSTPPEWSPAPGGVAPLEQPHTPIRMGLDLRLIGAVLVAALLAGAWGYNQFRHSAGADAQPGIGATRGDASDREGGADSARDAGVDPATGAPAPRSLSRSVEDALAAAERALAARPAPPAADGAATSAGATAAKDTAAKVDPSKLHKARRDRPDVVAPVRDAGVTKTLPSPPRPCSATLAALGLCQTQTP